MDFDLKDITEFLRTAAHSVGAEVTSPWFYLQVGLILAGAGIAFARRHRRSLAGRHGHAGDGLAGAAAACSCACWSVSSSTAIFAVLMRAGARHHAGIDLAEPQLYAGGRGQAGAGLAGHPAGHLRDPQRIYGPPGVAVGVAGRGAEHYRPARSRHRCAGFRLDRARRPAADAAAADQARRAADGGAVADQHRQQFPRNPDHPLHRSDAVDPGAAGQDDPARADGVRGRCRDGRGRHQPLGAGGLLRRGRRRHRFRPAEDRRQFHQRHHSAGRQVGEARRPRHHRRQFGPHQRDEDALYFGRRRRRPRIPDPERGPGDAEGRQLDLYRQEHAGEGHFRHQLRRRSAAGLQARDRDRRRRTRAPSRASRRTAS